MLAIRLARTKHLYSKERKFLFVMNNISGLIYGGKVEGKGLQNVEHNLMTFY